MGQIKVVTAIQREFDGYDRWSKQNVKYIGTQKETEAQLERINGSNAPTDSSYATKYYDILVRDATAEEVLSYIDSETRIIAASQHEIKRAEMEIEAAKNAILKSQENIRIASTDQ